MDKLLTLAEVAEALGVPVATLYQWRYKGTGPRGIRVGRHVRYRATDIEAWLAKQAAAQGALCPPDAVRPPNGGPTPTGLRSTKPATG